MTTDRGWIVQQVQMIASLVKREAREVWDDLYSEFGYRQNINFRRMAYVAEKKTIDVIEAEGLLAEFAQFVDGYLREKTPALPEQEKKAPVQGSLLEGEQK